MNELTEHQFTELIEARASELGLLTHFCKDNRTCRGPRGFPDLVIVGRYGLIFAELKIGDKDTTPLQNLWIWTLDEATRHSAITYVAVWRPDDLKTGVIDEWLSRLIKPVPGRNHGSLPRNNVGRRFQGSRAPRPT